jgi:hypothetical protein
MGQDGSNSASTQRSATDGTRVPPPIQQHLRDCQGPALAHFALRLAQISINRLIEQAHRFAAENLDFRQKIM